MEPIIEFVFGQQVPVAILKFIMMIVFLVLLEVEKVKLMELGQTQSVRVWVDMIIVGYLSTPPIQQLHQHQLHQARAKVHPHQHQLHQARAKVHPHQ
jgi:hypothetical protein